jgi:hypothetical protein
LTSVLLGQKALYKETSLSSFYDNSSLKELLKGDNDVASHAHIVNILSYKIRTNYSFVDTSVCIWIINRFNNDCLLMRQQKNKHKMWLQTVVTCKEISNIDGIQKRFMYLISFIYVHLKYEYYYTINIQVFNIMHMC